MRNRILTALSILTTAIIIVTQLVVCTSAPEHPKIINEDNTKPANAKGETSHFFGLNCVLCHRDGGKAPGIFTIAGSVLDEERLRIHKNPVVQLYTQPFGKGSLIATIRGDSLGNFYTKEEIDLSEGVYAVLIGSEDAAEPIKYMERPVGAGQCNACHGNKQEMLGID